MKQQFGRHGAGNWGARAMADIDIFKVIIAPVFGGLGIFLLGLEFMANGIQALSANRLRAWLAQTAGTPIRGVLAGTIITGIIQSSTAMTVMTVGLVNAGVLGLRSAISVIMGANVGTTLGNGLIALPLGPLGLFVGGIFATIYVFARSDRMRNVALAVMGFALIFYGLSLMTGGLRPLRDMPEVLSIIQSVDASNYRGVIMCALIAATMSALIHSSSATLGIVMGLGASGILSWETAIAFAIGADLGTTVTAWLASLNLSKNAKRAAYAHIAFNFIGVSVVLALFFPAMALLKAGFAAAGIDPGAPVLVDGVETFPGVPIAIGIFSIVFNVFNVLILFPFVGVFESVLSRVGRSADEDVEDYSFPRFLDKKLIADFNAGLHAVQQEALRHLEAGAVFIGIALNRPNAPKDPALHLGATQSLGREIRAFQTQLFKDGLSDKQLELVASLIEELDESSALSDALFQIASRAKQQAFKPAARGALDQGLQRLELAMNRLLLAEAIQPKMPAGHSVLPSAAELREGSLHHADIAANEKGLLIGLLGAIERAEGLIDQITAERASADRTRIHAPAAPATTTTTRTDGQRPPGGAPVPA